MFWGWSRISFVLPVLCQYLTTSLDSMGEGKDIPYTDHKPGLSSLRSVPVP